MKIIGVIGVGVMKISLIHYKATEFNGKCVCVF